MNWRSLFSRFTGWALLRQLGETSALQIFRLGRSGAVFLIAILLSKLAVSREALAPYEGMALIQTGLSFALLDALGTQFNAVYAGFQPARKAAFLGTTSFLSGMAGAVVALGIWLLSFTEASVSPGAAAGFALFGLFNFVALPTEYFLLAESRHHWLIPVGILSFGSQVAAVVLPFWLLGGFTWSFYALAGVGALRAAFWLILAGPRLPVRLDRRLLFWQLREAAPLMLMFLVAGSARYIDSFFARSFLSVGAFVLFRYGARELPLGLILSNSVSTTAVKRMAAARTSAEWADTLARLRRQSRRLYHMLFPLACVLMLLSPLLFRYVYSPAFVPAASVFNIFLLQTAPRALLPHSLLLAQRRNRLLFRISAIEWALHIALSLLLVHSLGLHGLAIAAVGSFLLERSLMIVANWRHGWAPASYIDWRLWGGYTLLLASCFVVSQLFIVNP